MPFAPTITGIYDLEGTRQLCVFFFQAEGGIRDDLVTGVQTCALPILCDSKGVINNSRTSLNKEKMRFAETTTNAINLKEAMVDADIFVGLSVPGCVTPDMIRSIDRKSVVQGKSVELGGRRIIKKKKK